MTRPPLRIVAILQTYNERRFVAGCIEHLNEQGVLVYVIDNESTDDTPAIAERYLGRGVIGIEQLPREDCVDYTAQYARKQELAQSLEADWLLHVDADERHDTPGRRTTLAEAIADADARGFNAINFIEFTFIPTAESPDHDHRDFERTMRWYYAFLPVYPYRVNAWKRQEGPVDLVSTDGHLVVFAGQRLAPQPLHMRHYQILSLGHASEKYGVAFHPDRVQRLRGHWTIDFEPERITFPPAARLQRWREGAPLDASRPERAHQMVDGAWFNKIGRPLPRGARPLIPANLELRPEFWLPECSIELAGLDGWRGEATYRGHRGLVEFLAASAGRWGEWAGPPEVLAPSNVVVAERRGREGEAAVHEVTAYRGGQIWHRHLIARRWYFSDRDHARTVADALSQGQLATAMQLTRRDG